MHPAVRAALVLALPLMATACASNQIVARDPEPPPPAGYRVACGTVGLPFYLRFSHCEPVAPPARAKALRVRG